MREERERCNSRKREGGATDQKSAAERKEGRKEERDRPLNHWVGKEGAKGEKGKSGLWRSRSTSALFLGSEGDRLTCQKTCRGGKKEVREGRWAPGRNFFQPVQLWWPREEGRTYCGGELPSRRNNEGRSVKNKQEELDEEEKGVYPFSKTFPPPNPGRRRSVPSVAFLRPLPVTMEVCGSSSSSSSAAKSQASYAD